MIRRFLRWLVKPLDLPLLAICASLAFISLVAVASASPERLLAQAGNLLVAFTCMWVVAQIPPQKLMRLAIPAYLFGFALLIAVALFGDISKGARRWLNLGVTRIQPSEMMKIAMPMMLAWYFHVRERSMRLTDYGVAAIFLILPTLLIARQPDLGTAILVLASGAFVIFFAGLPWRMIIGFTIITIAALPVVWNHLHDYQQARVLTLLDPEQDPLGKGFHIIQSTIAIGSGGWFGKGWRQGTQSQLEFIPERHTDFILAVISEEFGLIGIVVLLGLYTALIMRGLGIAGRASSVFSRLLAGAIALIYMTYAAVNMGMVGGILPVVGVPLPFISYGGTALVTLFVGAGILMSIEHARRYKE